jgi:hypothetical protein
VTPEAELVATERGLIPKGQGWFVLNARETQWWERPGRGVLCEFEGAGFEGATDFPQLGVNLTRLGPGEPMSMYHWEVDQEDFLVLAGEALLIVEGQGAPAAAVGFRALPAGDETHDRRRTVPRALRRRARPFDGAGLGRLHGGRRGAPQRCGRRAGDHRSA